MQIEKDVVVAIDYTLKADDGQVVDSSEGRQPLYYLHGHSNIVEGLEEALVGKGVGDHVSVSVPPEKGYGARQDALVIEVPKDQLPKDVEPRKGLVLHMTNDSGEGQPVVIMAVKLRTVVMDANHELAGKVLHFTVDVREVRKAKSEELQRGHADGVGQHQPEAEPCATACGCSSESCSAD